METGVAGKLIMGRAAFIVLMRCWIVALALCGAQPVHAIGAMAVPQWGGEYLRPDQGLISVEARAEGFLGTTEEPLLIYILNAQIGQIYLISQPISSGEPNQRPFYWKVPVGNYQVINVKHTRGSTVKSTSTFRARNFVVESFALSDLGVWVARSTKKGPLVVKLFTRTVQSFTFPSDDVLSAIIDGFSGKRLRTLKGGANSEKSRVNFGSQDEMRATITETREVSMVYKMDLARYGRYNNLVFPLIQRRDSRFRQCYLDGLQLKDNLRGTARFTFTLAAGRGTIQALKYKGGTLLDQRTVECLYAELGQMEFPVKAPITGTVTFAFDANF